MTSVANVPLKLWTFIAHIPLPSAPVSSCVPITKLQLSKGQLLDIRFLVKLVVTGDGQKGKKGDGGNVIRKQGNIEGRKRKEE